MLNLAVLTFFAPDPLATKRPKPEVANIWAVDPPPEEDGSISDKLSELTENEFFKLYYEQCSFLFDKNPQMLSVEPFLWEESPNSNLRIGILSDVLRAIKSGDYFAIPKYIHLALERFPFIKELPSWVGDGIVVESLNRSSKL